MSIALGAAPGFAMVTPLKEILNENKELQIRVRMGADVGGARIKGFDLKVQSADRRLFTLNGSGSVRVTCVGDRIWVTHRDQVETAMSPIKVGSQAGFLFLNGRSFREELRVYAKGSHCEYVNHVAIEKYLDGLVNVEFSASWDRDAIGAQVIAARTYAIYQMMEARRLKRHYDLDSTVKDQVYDGSAREDYRASQAVERTRGQVLTVGENDTLKPIKAFYHSTCGGKTQTSKHAFGKAYPGVNRSVVCKFCNVSPSFLWSLEMNSSEVQDRLRTALRDGIIGAPLKTGTDKDWKALLDSPLMGIQISKMDATGRALEVDLAYADPGMAKAWGNILHKRKMIRISSNQLRRALSPLKMRSTAFVVQRSGQIFTFKGRGYGHGAGLCQYGAKRMGELGNSTTKILTHYYPEARIKKLW